MTHRSPVEPDISDISVETSDGVTLRGLHLRPRCAESYDADASTRDLAFVISHGMTNATSKTSTRAVLTRFQRYGGVVALDFRGHGRSGGRSSVGRDEIYDVDAAVAFARQQGYRRVVTVGFSMGGAVTLRYAGSLPDPLDPGHIRTRPDAVVSVSAPSRWYIRSSSSMRRVHWMLEHPLGGLVGRFAGIRLGEPWAEVPRTPLEMVGSIAPVPLLIVHGSADRYFTVREAVDLHSAAAGSELWIEPDMGHAESGVGPRRIDRIAGWAAAAV